MHRRRTFALAAILAIAFAALWPLVSAAKPKSAAIPTFICTQSGAPHVPSGDGDTGDDFHCPLCVASADFIPASSQAAFVPALRVRLREGFAPAAAVHEAFSPWPPPSRAPPALS